MVEGLTYIEDSLSRVARCSSSLFSSFKVCTPAAFSHRGVEQWQLVGLITRRSGVRIPSPLPNTLWAAPQQSPPGLREGFLVSSSAPFPAHSSQCTRSTQNITRRD